MVKSAKRAATVVRIDHVAVLVFGDRVDRQVAAQQVVLERHAAIGVELEAVVAGTGLALGARERVFFARRGVEKDGEVAPDRDVAGGAELVGIRADDDPIAIAWRQTEQSVTNGAADEIALHRSECFTRRHQFPTDGRPTPMAAGCSVGAAIPRVPPAAARLRSDPSSEEL